MSANIQLIRNTQRIIKAMDDIAAKRMTEACMHLQGEVKRTLSGSRSGRTYKVPGTKNRTYTASAPGEPPASLTGQLRTSINFQIEGGGVLRISGLIGTALDKGPWLEFGNSQMAARPFLDPTFKREKEKVKEILSRKWF